MEKRENQRVALTKRLLKEGLLRLMEKKSVNKISVSELCQAAGINRSTFYNHYGSQFDLLKEMEMDLIAGLDDIWELDEIGNLSANRRAEVLGTYFCSYFKEHEHIAKLLFRNSDTDSEFAALLFQSPQVQYIFQKGLSSFADRDNKKLLMTYFSNGVYSLIRQWILEDIPKTPEEIGKLIYEINEALINKYRGLGHAGR